MIYSLMKGGTVIRQTFSDPIKNSIALIESRLDSNLGVNELAEQAFFSKTHYQRLFSSIVGEPVMEYIRKRRLQLACRDLCETKATVLEIALKYGYASHEGFTRAFKAHFGIAPIRFRKLNTKFYSEKFHYKEDAKMLSNEILKKLVINMESVAEILGKFIKDAEELSEHANQTASAEMENGRAVLILSQELRYLAGRTGKVKDDIKSFYEHGQSVFEIFGKIFSLIKNLDDITFQMNLLRFLSGIEMSKIVEASDVFIPIDMGYNDLCKSLVNKKNGIDNLINDLILLIYEDIKMEAADRIRSAVKLLNQTMSIGNEIKEYTKAVSVKLNSRGIAFLRIADGVGIQTEKIMTVTELFDCYAHDIEKVEYAETSMPSKTIIASAMNLLGDTAFYMNLYAFNASIETARENNDAISACTEKIRKYAGHLHQTHASCTELFNECTKLSDLLLKNKKKTTDALIQKTLDDILSQGEIMSIQLGIESERINLSIFKGLVKNAAEALSDLSKVRWDNDTASYRNVLMEYYETTLKLTNDCHREAANTLNGNPFEYIALEYDKFSERILHAINTLWQ